MYDGWVSAYDNGEVTGVCLLDMSAAFDIVDHTILLRKLELYGFQKSSLDWVHRCLYKWVTLKTITSSSWGSTRVYPGSLLYTLFTNELPEVVHHHDPMQVPENCPLKTSVARIVEIPVVLQMIQLSHVQVPALISSLSSFHLSL